MKRKIVLVLLFVSLICLSLPQYSVYAVKNKPLDHSTEEQYKYIIGSLLLPYIQKSVGNYYTKFLTEMPLVDPWDIEILGVERPNDFYVFVIKIKVRPYVGPHLEVGVDYITITVQGTGDVKVNNFEHIKSNYLDLPPNYQKIIKKNLDAN